MIVPTGRSYLSVAWTTGVQLVFFFCSRFSLVLFGVQGSPHHVAYCIDCICEPSFLFILDFTFLYLFILDEHVDELEIHHEDRTSNSESGLKCLNERGS